MKKEYITPGGHSGNCLTGCAVRAILALDSCLEKKFPILGNLVLKSHVKHLYHVSIWAIPSFLWVQVRI